MKGQPKKKVKTASLNLDKEFPKDWISRVQRERAFGGREKVERINDRERLGVGGWGLGGCVSVGMAGPLQYGGFGY